MASFWSVLGGHGTFGVGSLNANRGRPASAAEKIPPPTSPADSPCYLIDRKRTLIPRTPEFTFDLLA